MGMILHYLLSMTQGLLLPGGGGYLFRLDMSGFILLSTDVTFLKISILKCYFHKPIKKLKNVQFLSDSCFQTSKMCHTWFQKWNITCLQTCTESSTMCSIIFDYISIHLRRSLSLYFNYFIGVTAVWPVSPWGAYVAMFYGRLWLVRSVLRASTFSVLKLIEIVIVWVYHTHTFG